MIAERDFAGRQYIGRRQSQQDYYAFAEIAGTAKSLLLVLADGMGGYQGGEEASCVAVTSFIDAFQNSHHECRDRFAVALNAANDSILAAIRANPEELDGMGTTLVGMAITAAGLEWTSVGDSPLLLLRGSKLKRLNADHSMRAVIEQKVRNGQISEKDAARYPGRTQLRSAVIGEEIKLVDGSPGPVSLYAGDVIIAASDGVETLETGHLMKLVRSVIHKDAATIAMTLLNAVKSEAHPKQDNTTVAIIKVSDSWLQDLRKDKPLGSSSVAAQSPQTRKIRRSPGVAANKGTKRG